MFTIDEGIPVPPRASRSPGESKYPFVHMEVGDSFLVPVDAANGDTTTKARGRIAQACTKASKRYDVKFIARAVSGGVRVWRSE
jgi:hypothetical protein